MQKCVYDHVFTEVKSGPTYVKQCIGGKKHCEKLTNWAEPILINIIHYSWWHVNKYNWLSAKKHLRAGGKNNRPLFLKQ